MAAQPRNVNSNFTNMLNAARTAQGTAHPIMPGTWPMGSSVVFENGPCLENAAQKKVKHKWLVMRVTERPQHRSAFDARYDPNEVHVCGVGDGLRLGDDQNPANIQAQDLVEPGESTGWLGVHYALVMGCGLGVVQAVLETHPEVSIPASLYSLTCFSLPD